MASSPAGRTVALAKSQREAFLFGALEGGFFTDPLGSGRPGQMKTTLNYSWQWFMAETSYQKGAYYLYEYMMANNKVRSFTALHPRHRSIKHIEKAFAVFKY